jgi:hypothetical protein
MATQKGSGLISRAVREALSTLVSPTLCEQLINRSLASQGLAAVPESGTEIGEWLEGSLRGEVETAVGPDAADLMMMQLGPIAAYAAIAQPSLPVSAPSPAHVYSASNRASDPDLDDRPTDLRFDVSGEPVWSPASAPPPQKRAFSSGFGGSSQPPSRADSEPPTHPGGLKPGGRFGSDPPTGVFSAPKDGNPVGSFLKGRNSEPPVRTLPPVQRVSDVPPPPAVMPAPLERPSAPRGRTARPAPQDADQNKALPLVLTATSSREALTALRRYLSNAATVVHVPDLVGLLDALEEPDVVEPVVLVDCHSPTVHISSVAAIGEDLPRGTTVVLWGVDDLTWQQIDRERSPACRWVRCSSEATTDDVGSLCSMLLG